jgi:hypothetical protein
MTNSKATDNVGIPCVQGMADLICLLNLSYFYILYLLNLDYLI